MKVLLINATCILLAVSGYAQSTEEDRLTVSFSDPSQPGTVDVSLISGSIRVKAYDGKEVMVDVKEAVGKNQPQRNSRPVPPEAAGLKRIPNFSAGIRIEEEGNVIRIGSDMPFRPVELSLEVPVRTNLKLKTISNGDIEAEQIHGEIEVSNISGGVTLRRVSGSVLAHALNGKLEVSLVGVEPDKPMSFSSLNGDIDVSLPPDIRASISMKSNNGEIYSDFDIKTDTQARPTVEQRGKRIRIDRTTKGTINGGGPEIQFKTFNGNIYIRKSLR